ncbi:NHL domain-containing thioredoxin family protein [Cellulomonas sp. KH9]|uniref:NHL domain-containing thioredoxin family protein n=1 Tax=Cellulomonas sp. KH9 TaxID=1855324 RepID=UPI0008ECCAD4|nr:NHL domain-containing thioredoxin family protein [Cellulomonas sp. KH9]SFK45663.1 Thiol-disulfide isomerase or thioredoxin [Cellulomonas sp. KH9]
MTSTAAPRLPRVRASELVGRGWLNTGGKDVTLADLRGKVVVLDFWTFCCINCLHVLDELREIEERHRDVLVIIGVHSPKFVHEADPVALAAAVERYEVHHPVLDDPDLVTWQAFTARAWPTLVVIDPEGYVVAQMAGEGHAHAVETLVRDLVTEHEAKGTLHRGDGPYVAPTPQPTTLRFPAKAVELPGGTFLVADAGHHALTEVAADGETLVRRIGSGERGLVDGGPDEARFSEPNGLCLVPHGLRERVGYDVLVADTVNHALRGVRLADGYVTTVAGTGEQYMVGAVDNVTPFDGDTANPAEAGVGDQWPPRQVKLSSPWDVTWSQRLSAFVVAMAGNHTLWAFDPEQGSVTHLAGTMNEGLVDGAPELSWFAQPSGLSVDADGRIWLADAETSALRWVDPEDASVHSVAGTGLFDFGHRDGAADQALFQHPLGVAALPDGSVLVADTYNGALRRWQPGDGDAPGTVTTLATDLAEPSGLVLPAGDTDHVLVVESAAHRLTRIALPAGAGEQVDAGAHRTQRPVTEIGTDVALEVVFHPAAGQKLDDRWGPSTSLQVSATPAGLLLNGAGDDVALTRTLRLDPTVGEGVLHVTARAASCDADPAIEHPACHLAAQDWGVPVRVVTGAPESLTLPLHG